MAKIAVELKRAVEKRIREGSTGGLADTHLASGPGWSARDILCTSGPQDETFEEQHDGFSVAIVAAGSFQYRTEFGREMLTPGSLFLGNHGRCFQCGHEHGSGDRCISFAYSQEFFERLASDAGLGGRHFSTTRIPALKGTSSLVASAISGLDGDATLAWEELAIKVATAALSLSNRETVTGCFSVDAESRVTRSVRRMEQHPERSHSLTDLARQAQLSPYHFLRTFERLTGVTPHQYLLRTRLRESALRLSSESSKIIDIAFDSGFGDLSNFNRNFRSEFGMSPREYRKVTK